MKLPAIHSTPHTDVSIFSQLIHQAHMDKRKRDIIFRHLTYPFDAEHREVQQELLNSFTPYAHHQEQKKNLLRVMNAWHKAYSTSGDYLTFKISKSRIIRIRKAESILFGPLLAIPATYKLKNSSLAYKKRILRKTNSMVLA
jgi:hypothetical protein